MQKSRPSGNPTALTWLPFSYYFLLTHHFPFYALCSLLFSSPRCWLPTLALFTSFTSFNLSNLPSFVYFYSFSRLVNAVLFPSSVVLLFVHSFIFFFFPVCSFVCFFFYVIASNYQHCYSIYFQHGLYWPLWFLCCFPHQQITFSFPQSFLLPPVYFLYCLPVCLPPFFYLPHILFVFSFIFFSDPCFQSEHFLCIFCCFPLFSHPFLQTFSLFLCKFRGFGKGNRLEE